MDGESRDIKQDRLQRLKEFFPELFAEGQLDWEKLKAAFGEDINFDNERHVLNWAGKSDAFKILQQPTTATIADIGKERIRRVIQRIEKSPLTPLFQRGEQESMTYEKGETISPTLAKGGEGGFDDKKLDLGFKVFKLSPSNFKIWRGSEIDSQEKLAQQLDAFTDPIKPGAEKQNMLYEFMLKTGRELTDSVQYVTLNHPSPQSSPPEGRGGLKVPATVGHSGGYYSINNNELIIALDAMNETLTITDHRLQTEKGHYP